MPLESEKIEFVLKKETCDISSSKDKYLCVLKYSLNFEEEKLFLNSKLVNQILKNKKMINIVVKDFVDENKEKDFNKINKAILSINRVPNIDVFFIGRYFYIKIGSCIEYNNDIYINHIKRKLKHNTTL